MLKSRQQFSKTNSKCQLKSPKNQLPDTSLGWQDCGGGNFIPSLSVTC